MNRYYYQPIYENGILKIPYWCFEDTPIEYTQIEETTFGEIFISDSLSGNEYRDCQKKSYFACRWYPQLVEAGIPTIKSFIISSSIHDLRADLIDNFSLDYSFVRLCGCSPKDVDFTCIFNSGKAAADALIRSQRTLNIIQNYHHCHLFLRQPIDLLNECRCIVHQRAISVYQYVDSNEERKQLESSSIDFFEKYGKDLPYNSAVIELGWSISTGYHNPFIIEINSFGITGWAGASLFDWNSEMMLLYHTCKPIFRYPQI
jgi:hypothetical protein